MKYYIPFLIATALFACSEANETETETTVEDQIVVEDTIETTKKLEIRAYTLFEFPSVWWMATFEGEELSIVNHWDAQEMKFEVTAETESTGFIDMTHAHDSDGGPLFDFKAEISEQGDDLSVINGSFSYLSTLDMDTTHVTFRYDRLSEYAEFIGMHFSSDTFVEDSLKSVFPYIETVREAD